MEKMPLEEFLHTMEEGLQKIYSQLELLGASPTLSDKDVTALNQAQNDTRALIIVAGSPLERMKREDMRLQHPIVTTFEKDGLRAECAIRDVGTGGALIWLDQDIETGEQIAVNFPDIGLIDCIVTGTSDSGTHLEFDRIPKATSEEILDSVLTSEHL